MFMSRWDDPHRLQPEGPIGFENGLHFVRCPISQHDRHAVQSWVDTHLWHDGTTFHHASQRRRRDHSGGEKHEQVGIEKTCLQLSECTMENLTIYERMSR